MTLGMELYDLKYIKNSKTNDKIGRLSNIKLDVRYDQVIP